MKKITRKQRETNILLNKVRFNRRLSSKLFKKYGVRLKRNGTDKKIKPRRKDVIITAPAYVDIYNPRNHLKFIKFKNEVEKQSAVCASSDKPLMLCFRDTYLITAAAGLLLIAFVDTLKHKHPDLKFRVSRPHKQPIKGSKKPINIVDSVLSQIGFYELIGYPEYVSSSNVTSVKCWKYASSTESDGEIAGEILKQLPKGIISTSALYRSCIEAIANAAEHAYSKDVKTKKSFSTEKWWIFVGHLNNELIILVCDLGHGIPNTLETTQEASFMKALWSRLGFSSRPSSDCEFIRASTIVKETRTKMSHRGLGTTDLRTFVDKTEKSKMLIFSNKGYYSYHNPKSGRPSLALDNQLSIGGTIVQWSVPTEC